MRRLRDATTLLVLAGSMLLPSPGFAQSPLLSGSEVLAHAGLQVVGSGRLGTSSTDSTWSIAVGGDHVWIIRPGLLHPVVLNAPGGSSQAFGGGATILRSFTSDNFDALAVGDPGYGGGRGRVSIYLGSTSFSANPSLTLAGESPGDLFGAGIGYAGDVNGDGFGDLAVGAPGRTSGMGKVYVFAGGPSPSTTPAMTATGTAVGDLFGTAISTAGDLNADGFAEFLVGAPGAGGVGAVSVFHGGSVLTNAPAQVIPFPGSLPAYGDRPRFGASVAGGRDLDGDGVPDFAVGAPGTSGGRGSVFALHGAAGTINPSGHEFTGMAAFDRFGSSVALGAFVDGIIPKLAAGSPGATEGRGSVRVFNGGAGGNYQPIVFLTGRTPDDAFGFSVAAAGLFRLTSVPQLLVGAPLSDSGATNAGAAYYYAVPPAVDVEETQLIVEADGAPLTPSTYTSTSPTLILRLPGAASVDAAGVEITLDASKLADAQAEPSGDVPDGLELRLIGLTEGPHTLGARVFDGAHSRVGTVSVAFHAAARLRIETPAIFPNPAFGDARLRFILTRPAGFDLQLFDLSGRRVYELGPTRGVPAENEASLGRFEHGGRVSPGLYFYVLSAQYQDQKASARGRVVFLR